VGATVAVFIGELWSRCARVGTDAGALEITGQPAGARG
jgi:hypothetical protein